MKSFIWVILFSLLLIGCKVPEIKATNLSITNNSGDLTIYHWYTNEDGVRKWYSFYNGSLMGYKLFITEYSNATGDFDGKKKEYNNQKMTDVIYNNIRSFKINGKLFYF